MEEFFSSKFGEVSSLLSGQTEKALNEASKALGPAIEPARPFLDELGTQASRLRELGVKVSSDLLRDEGVIVERATPVLRGLTKYGTPRNIFNAENLAIFPLWAGVVLAPNSRLVKAFWSSYLPIIIGALAYVWLTYLAFNDPVSLEGFSGMNDLSVLTKVRSRLD